MLLRGKNPPVASLRCEVLALTRMTVPEIAPRVSIERAKNSTVMIGMSKCHIYNRASRLRFLFAVLIVMQRTYA